MRGSALRLETTLSGLLMFPKTLDSEGHACWQAVLNAGSGVLVTSLAPAFTERAIFASSMRWMQKVHFSMTPRMRTVTFGFFDILRLSAMPLGARGP